MPPANCANTSSTPASAWVVGSMVWAKLNPAFRLRICAAIRKTSRMRATPNPTVTPTAISGSAHSSNARGIHPRRVDARPERVERQRNRYRQHNARQRRAALKAGQGRQCEDSGNPRQHQQKPVQRRDAQVEIDEINGHTAPDRPTSPWCRPPCVGSSRASASGWPPQTRPRAEWC
jgi:hypothetical protein